jgi:hypothetical protein
MMTPELAEALAAVDAVDEMEELAEFATGLHTIAGTLVAAARVGDARQLAMAAEELLPLHVEFARLYRSWLAAHTVRPAWVPSVVPAGRVSPGSDDAERCST